MLRRSKTGFAQALVARDAIAAAAARRLSWSDARELANTVAQHVVLGHAACAAIANVIHHRIKHGWLPVADAEEGLLCSELIAAWDAVAGEARANGLRPSAFPAPVRG